MWRLLQSMLTGQTNDPVLIFFGGLGALIIFLGFFGFLGVVCAAVVARVKPSACKRGTVLPWLVGAGISASLMTAATVLVPAAVMGVSSWVMCLSAGIGAGIGFWVSYSEVNERVPETAILNPFHDGDDQPFGTTAAPTAPPFEDEDVSGTSN